MKTKDKNLIAQFIFLFILGWGISLYIGNIIITIIVCFIFGLILKKTKVGKIFIEKSKPRKPPDEVKCNQCGTIIQKSDFKFCSSCGARIVKLPDLKAIGNGRIYYPDVISEKLRSLKNCLDAGEVDAQTYYWLFSDIVIIDEKRRYWSVGADSLNWYRSQNGEWINDTPSGKLQIIRKSDKFLI